MNMRSVAIALFGTLVAQHTIPGSAIPSFIINLDLPPESRWTEVVTYYRAEMIAMGQALGPILRKHLGNDYDSWISMRFSPEYAEYDAELQGMVTAINHSQFTVQSMRLMNMLYEMQSPTACGGVLWAMANGTVMHGRNMDYGFHFTMPDGRTLNWPDVTYEATMMKGGRPLFKQTQWPGSVGVHTAMRFGGWSFEQNTRMTNEWHANLNASKYGGQPNGIVVRKIMETTPDFKTAVEKIYAAKFMAPQYFIMSGSGAFEGAVLTIDRLGKHKGLPDTPPVQYVSNSSDTAWHLVQTNDDQLGTPLDSRRPVANYELSHMTQKMISEPNLLQFMHTPPLFAPATVFTTVMVPASGYFKTILPNDPPTALEGIKKGIQVFTRSSHSLLEMNRSTRDVLPDMLPLPEKVKSYLARVPRTRKRFSLRGNARDSQSEGVGDISSFMQLAIRKQEI